MASAPPLLQDTNSILDPNQVNDVVEVLVKCKFPDKRWLELGLWLGLLKTTLDIIDTKHKRNARLCLSDCMLMWLNKADNVISRCGPPTWDSLSNTLRDIDAFEVADALDVEKRPYHAQTAKVFTARYQTLLQCLREPVSVTRSLYEEKVLSYESLSKVVSTRGSSAGRRKVLLEWVKKAVQDNPQHLETFGLVLTKCTGTGNVPLGKAILKDYKKVLQNLSNNTVVDEEGEEGSSATTLPSPATPSTPINEVQVPMLQSMSRDFSSIRASYGRMFFRVRKAIVKNPPPLEKLVLFLKDCYRHLEMQLSDVENLASVLRVIEDECSLIDIEILVAVVHEFDITEAKAYIEEYKVRIEEFCRDMSVRLCLKERFEAYEAHTSLKCESATYVFDWEPDRHRLKDITDILSKTSGKLVKIKYIETVCSITVHCTFPHSRIGLLIAHVMENIELLKENGLMELTIGYCRVFKRDQYKARGVVQDTSKSEAANERDEEVKMLEEKVQLLTKQLALFEAEKDKSDDSGQCEEKLNLQQEVENNHQLTEETTENKDNKRTTQVLVETPAELSSEKELESCKTTTSINNKLLLETEELNSALKMEKDSTAEIDQSLAESKDQENMELLILQQKNRQLMEEVKVLQTVLSEMEERGFTPAAQSTNTATGHDTPLIIKSDAKNY